MSQVFKRLAATRIQRLAAAIRLDPDNLPSPRISMSSRGYFNGAQ
jgi:hypothetical protein